RDRLPAARGDDAGARADHLTALEQRPDGGVVLELLEGLERKEPRVFVIQTHDVTDVQAIVAEVIDEAAAVRAAIERPAQRVLYQTRFHAPRRELPELLHPERIRLRRAMGI